MVEVEFDASGVEERVNHSMRRLRRRLKCGSVSRVRSATSASHVLIFFFQAEDGIRYLAVTGVQTCALPISVCGALIRSERKDGVHHSAPFLESTAGMVRNRIFRSSHRDALRM